MDATDPPLDDDEICWGLGVTSPACGKPVVCAICESCETHCNTEGGPDQCWLAHEAWRHGDPDPAFATVTASRTPIGIGPAPRPRWRS